MDSLPERIPFIAVIAVNTAEMHAIIRRALAFAATLKWENLFPCSRPSREKMSSPRTEHRDTPTTWRSR